MLESLNYSFRNPKNIIWVIYRIKQLRNYKKNHGVLRGPQLAKQRWRPRLGILRVKQTTYELASIFGPWPVVHRVKSLVSRLHVPGCVVWMEQWRWTVKTEARITVMSYPDFRATSCRTTPWGRPSLSRRPWPLRRTSNSATARHTDRNSDR